MQFDEETFSILSRPSGSNPEEVGFLIPAPVGVGYDKHVVAWLI
jgi:hypothetical protein